MVKSLGEDSQHLHYVLHCCQASAKEAIRHYIMLPNDRGYAEALGILKARYGRPHHVLQAVTASLLEGGKLPSGDVDALHRLASQIRCCLSTLDQVGRASDLDCPAY